MNLESLPPRIKTSKVCELAGFSRGELAKRIKKHTMPAPVDRAKGNLFLKSAVLKALGLAGEVQETGSFDKVPDGY